MKNSYFKQGARMISELVLEALERGNDTILIRIVPPVTLEYTFLEGARARESGWLKAHVEQEEEAAPCTEPAG